MSILEPKSSSGQRLWV